MDNPPLEEEKLRLSDLPVGGKLLVRTKKEWRTAVISRFEEERVVLMVCSPTGRTYRLRRELDMEIILDGGIAILKIDTEENWRENFTKYDLRW